METPLNNIMFANELNRLSFEINAAKAVFKASIDGKAVFEQTYYPDSENTVTVYDFDKLLQASLKKLPSVLTLTVNGETLSPAAITLLPSTLPDPPAAADFIDTHFLTRGHGTRLTAAGRHEILSAYCRNPTAVTVTARYVTDAGALTSQDFSLGNLDSNSVSVDVSPGRFLSAAKGTLIAYTVKCGNRTMRYTMAEYLPEPTESIIFLNAFGVWETFFFTGIKETAPEYSRAQKTFGGRFFSYQIDTTIKYQLSTGPLPADMEFVVHDLAASYMVYLLNPDGTCGDEIVFTDADTKFTDEALRPVTMKLTYRRAEVHSAMLHAAYKPKVFDFTFSDEYE